MERREVRALGAAVSGASRGGRSCATSRNLGYYTNARLPVPRAFRQPRETSRVLGGPHVVPVLCAKRAGTRTPRATVRLGEHKQRGTAGASCSMRSSVPLSKHCGSFPVGP